MDLVTKFMEDFIKVIKDDVEKAAYANLAAWHAMLSDWRSNNRNSPMYGIRIRKRVNVLSIDWEYRKYFTDKSGVRRVKVISLSRNGAWMYPLKAFKLASEEQLNLIKEIEIVAGHLRFTMHEVNRHIMLINRAKKSRSAVGFPPERDIFCYNNYGYPKR